jgi:hypothetical protein
MFHASENIEPRDRASLTIRVGSQIPNLNHLSSFFSSSLNLSTSFPLKKSLKPNLEYVSIHPPPNSAQALTSPPL